ELGMNHPGEIRTLIRIAEPDVRVWTNVGDAHIGHFESREAIADAKAELLDAATPDTVLVANADDPLVVARTGKFVGRTVTFGEHPRADVRAQEIEDRGFDGTTARVRTRSGDATFSVPLPGRGQLSKPLAAGARGDTLSGCCAGPGCRSRTAAAVAAPFPGAAASPSCAMERGSSTTRTTPAPPQRRPCCARC